jgi:hypothetical protein
MQGSAEVSTKFLGKQELLKAREAFRMRPGGVDVLLTAGTLRQRSTDVIITLIQVHD